MRGIIGMAGNQVKLQSCWKRVVLELTGGSMLQSSKERDARAPGQTCRFFYLLAVIPKHRWLRQIPLHASHPASRTACKELWQPLSSWLISTPNRGLASTPWLYWSGEVGVMGTSRGGEHYANH